MTSPTSPINTSDDGQSITVENCTITFSTGFSPTSGVATITITPAGGLGTLPGVLQGPQGEPYEISAVNQTMVPYGTPLPDPPASITPIAPGIGILNISIPEGAPGASGTNATIADASDLSGTATADATIIWDAGLNEFTYAPQTIGKLFGPSSIASVSGQGGQQGQAQVLCTITLPAYPFPWFPVVLGGAIVNGTVNTQVELSANIGSVSGDQVSVGYGVTGLTQQYVALQSTIPPGASGTYGEIASGDTATIVVSATETASTTDGWSIENTQASFTVMVYPVGS